MSAGNPLFPIFLKLDKIQTLIVGAGNVGLEKLQGLLKNDPNAKIRVIAPFILDEVHQLVSQHEGVIITNRKFRNSDLRNIDILILATDDIKLHKRVRRLSRRRRILTNVADTPDLCDFYLGSTVKKGDLKIGISTNGKSPTFAKRFRQYLEECLPDETVDLLKNLKAVRNELKGDFSEKVRQLNELTTLLVRE